MTTSIIIIKSKKKLIVQLFYNKLKIMENRLTKITSLFYSGYLFGNYLKKLFYNYFYKIYKIIYYYSKNKYNKAMLFLNGFKKAGFVLVSEKKKHPILIGLDICKKNSTQVRPRSNYSTL